MSARADWPILDYALSRIGPGAPLRGVPVALARGIAPPAAAVLAARLRRAGADVRTDGDTRPCYLLGAAGGDTAGHLGITTHGSATARTLPAVDLSQSPLMRLAHDRIGIGQASVMALLDITNLQIAGRVVVVCGYGPVGAGVAEHARALGGRVTVVEGDPLRAVDALAQGHSVDRFAKVLPQAEVIFVTDGGPELGRAQVRQLSSGTILCAAGVRASVALAPDDLVGVPRSVRAHVEAFDLPKAHGLKLIFGGHPVHMAGGQGLPRDAQDIVLALHILALAQLLRDPSSPGESRVLDPAVEADVARHVVARMGGGLEGDTPPLPL